MRRNLKQLGRRRARSSRHRGRDPAPASRGTRRCAASRSPWWNGTTSVAATSANSLRIVHGGIRYLARGDLGGCGIDPERSALLRIAPGLVEPLPVLVPTGLPGCPAGRRSAPPSPHPCPLARPQPPSRPQPTYRCRALLSRTERCSLFPALDPGAITGAALWYDARMTHPARLTLAFVASAAAAGAQVANHAEAVDFDLAGDSTRGVEVRGVGVRRRSPARPASDTSSGPSGGDRGRSMDGDARRAGPAGPPVRPPASPSTPTP